ncbi:hypothetical protein AVEN_1317-1 [Araneus ventricosus]|uniref:Uncharacterized protein n=1 Tax=Araneus ventricosus TaxID=182803 RepID=A0A4Y2D2N1_ARAVE|nr:hypothetical protein AVEN_1317-1 [Araneus ventricosus]
MRIKEMQLPTYADIMRHYKWLRNENRHVYFQPVDDLVEMVGEKVTAIWIKASIPVVSKRYVNGRIKDSYKKCRSVEISMHHKGIKRRRTTKNLYKTLNPLYWTFQFVNVKIWTIVPATRAVKFQNERLHSCTIKELFEKYVSGTLTSRLAKPLKKQWLGK